MRHSASLPKLGSEFDTFLFAPVGNDQSGMVFSVLSALARLDVDPWQEAANLARLPGSAATERLTSLIAALPGGPTANPDLGRDPGAIASRLIALLPRSTGSAVPPRNAMAGDGGVTNAQTIVRIVAFNVILVAFMLSTQWLAISHTSIARVAQAPAATSQVNAVQPSTPNPGQ